MMMMSDMMRYLKVIFFLTGRSGSDSHHLKPHQLQERGPRLLPETSTSPRTRSSGLPYSPFEQVNNEFISSLPSSVESIGVRKSGILIRFKLDLCHVT